MTNLDKLLAIARVATHEAIDPDDTTGFTDDCFKAFCKHYGFNYPVDENYKYYAQTLWNETPGDAWRSAWLSGVQYPVNHRLIEKMLAEIKAGRELIELLARSQIEPPCSNLELRCVWLSSDKAREALDAEASLI